MAIDLTLITRINKQLSDKGHDSLCGYVQASAKCSGIDCNDCPFAESIHDYKKIQKNLDMVNLVMGDSSDD